LLRVAATATNAHRFRVRMRKNSMHSYLQVSLNIYMY